MEELTFGQWLSRQRKSLGMTQKGLADCVNCATITIRKLEADQRRPSLQVAERLAKIFNIPYDEQEAFSQFARGFKWSSALFEAHNAPWHPGSGIFDAHMVSYLLKHIEHSHALSENNRIFIDENIHLVNQGDALGEDPGSSLLEITHEPVTPSQKSQYYLLLVPIKVPADLSQMFKQENGVRGIAIKALSRKGW